MVSGKVDWWTWAFRILNSTNAGTAVQYIDSALNKIYIETQETNLSSKHYSFTSNYNIYCMSNTFRYMKKIMTKMWV